MLELSPSYSTKSPALVCSSLTIEKAPAPGFEPGYPEGNGISSPAQYQIVPCWHFKNKTKLIIYKLLPYSDTFQIFRSNCFYPKPFMQRTC
jgi:hypothetical protein